MISARAFDTLSGAEVYEMLRLRSAVFVVEQACAYLDPDGLDLEATHLLGRDATGALGAYARVLHATVDREVHRIGRVVVHPALRGAGEGRRLVREAMRVCDAAEPSRAIVLSAQAHLEAFYASLGFRRISAPFVLDGIDHVEMRRDPP